ncbi:MAG TPA: rhodanese-like domain-containing protein [Myxococcaceae bacterium]|nr:rhodanese-like domain-containing protein [Myxococcaceae bacterium]
MVRSLEVALAAVVLLAAGCAVFMHGDVSRDEAHRLVAGGALLLDVRSPEEFKSGHIDGAVNIPVQDLEARLGEVGPRERQVVVYCHSGMRSGRAAQVLRGAGYSGVRDLGPMERW